MKPDLDRDATDKTKKTITIKCFKLQIKLYGN